MNSQDLSNLQEAYLDVYELNEKFSDDTKRRAIRHIKDTKKLLRSMGAEIDNKYNPEPEGYEPESDKKIKKRTQREQVDFYDIILSHLLDEGYAETPEAAEVIMVNMSEDWREDIIEAYVPYEGKPQEKLRSKQDQLANKWDKSGSEKRFHKMGAVDSKMTNPEQKKYRDTVNTQRDAAVRKRGSNLG